MDKKFLIIHPTADGKSRIIETYYTKKKKEKMKGIHKSNVLASVLCCLPRKSTFSTYSEIHHPAHKRKGQLHLAGTWLYFHAVVTSTAANLFSLLVFFPLVQLFPSLWELCDLSGNPTAGRGLAFHNAFITHNEIMRPSWPSWINTRTNPIKIQCTAAEWSLKLISDRYRLLRTNLISLVAHYRF